jgi:tRNA(adenine34) deaminase
MTESVKTPEFYMRKTIAMADKAMENGEFPIAAIVVLDDKIIASASTAERREKRFLIHAELLALEAADKLGLSYEKRRAAKLFTNLEPCLMCIGAAMSFFIGEIYYALESPADGAVDVVKTWQRKVEDMPGYQLPKITGGVLRKTSIDLFKKYITVCPLGPMRDWAETLTKL